MQTGTPPDPVTSITTAIIERRVMTPPTVTRLWHLNPSFSDIEFALYLARDAVVHTMEGVITNLGGPDQMTADILSRWQGLQIEGLVTYTDDGKRAFMILLVDCLSDFIITVNAYERYELLREQGREDEWVWEDELAGEGEEGEEEDEEGAAGQGAAGGTVHGVGANGAESNGHV